ncbi:DUF433 domain-containing protein [bacterium]|nr:DUF433 domain-containing protein [bacterium]
MARVEIGKYLVIDSEICHGQLTFKGTRIPVETALAYLAMGYSVEQIIRKWPQLWSDAIEEAVDLATEALLERYTPSRKKVA